MGNVTDEVEDDFWDYLEDEGAITISQKTRAALANDPKILALEKVVDTRGDSGDFEECFDAAINRIQDYEEQKRRPLRNRKQPTISFSDKLAPTNCGVLGGIITRDAQVAESKLVDAVHKAIAVALPQNLFGDEAHLTPVKAAELYGIRAPNLFQVMEQLIEMDGEVTENTVLVEAASTIGNELREYIESPKASREERSAYLLELHFPGEGPVAIRDFVRQIGEGRVRDGGKGETELKVPDKFRTNGFLANLVLAAVVLGEKYSWDVVGGLVFLVLFGAYPTMHVVRVDYRIRKSHPGASRIYLTLDPELLPSQVKEIYAEAQGKLIGQSKSLSPKSLALASFAFTGLPSPIDQGMNFWESLMEDWNFEQRNLAIIGHPHYGLYNDKYRFKADALQTLERLVSPTFNTIDPPFYYPNTEIINAERRASAKSRKELDHQKKSATGSEPEKVVSGERENSMEMDLTESRKGDAKKPLNPPTKPPKPS